LLPFRQDGDNDGALNVKRNCGSRPDHRGLFSSDKIAVLRLVMSIFDDGVSRNRNGNVVANATVCRCSRANFRTHQDPEPLRKCYVIPAQREKAPENAGA
jgi:hypothetical protein